MSGRQRSTSTPRVCVFMSHHRADVKFDVGQGRGGQGRVMSGQQGQQLLQTGIVADHHHTVHRIVDLAQRLDIGIWRCQIQGALQFDDALIAALFARLWRLSCVRVWRWS